MSFENLTSLSQAGVSINEDLALANANWILVLDGSSGLTGRRYTSGSTDAAWFVQTTGREIAAQMRMNAERELHQVVKAALIGVEAAYRREIGSLVVETIDQPSASIAFVRATADGLEYLLMGDCLAVFQDARQNWTIHDDRVAAFDAVALAELRQMLQSGLAFAEARTNLAPTLAANRRKKNRADGYWVLAPNPACIEGCLCGFRRMETDASLLVMTDGFGQLVAPFERFPSYAALLEFVSQFGVDKAAQLLIEAAESDADCRTYPRFKKLDDFTCVSAHWRATGEHSRNATGISA